jgi:hypothetical protein
LPEETIKGKMSSQDSVKIIEEQVPATAGFKTEEQTIETLQMIESFIDNINVGPTSKLPKIQV